MSNDSEEKYLTLADGRTLAYADAGDPSSSVVVIFLHGVFGTGSAPLSLSPALVEKNAHQIVPTLAGWGYSSPRPSSQNYADTLTSDMTELITHLHPNTADLDIYVSGGSYGSVPAQMLYGAPFDKFPLGRHIRGCLILAPFSPFKWHKGYTKSMTWANYISVGPPYARVPVPASSAHHHIRVVYADEHGGQSGRHAAQVYVRGSAGGARGVCAIARGAGHRGGGVGASDGERHGQEHLEDLDKDHTSGRPILIAASTNDELGPDMASWLKENYANSRLKWVPGKHVSTLYEVDNLWAELLAMANESASSPAAL
ncbi:AB hydrolase-1 domain-containing protein [Mycena sanguinolenta]|uniref:AB hydrolase-1 domain-containing protein n=1 Tax=Mycena sanguinolenta TaxID=230812 RepID=A0A8H6ZB02_9AGAR|nr:AB hydrolase-1 domain-containing protein [Mycena sanguinolenta]